MLYLDAPYPVIDGVSFLRDSAGDRNWFYLPLAPDFVTRPDPTTGQPIPAFNLLRYRSAQGNGGLLSFDVQCSVDPDRLDTLATKLAQQQGLAERPTLMPVPLTSGTVKLMLFDLESGQQPDPQAPIRFVKQIAHHASPALYGRNEAVFSVQLDQAGVSALESSMRGDLSPIGVVYALEFLALRPAYAVTLTVDWDRVQEHLDSTFGVDALFFSSQISEAVDKLVDERAIVLQADTFVPEGEDERSVLARRDRAVNEVRDMITQAFFEPSINPTVAQEDGWDKVSGLANDLSRLAVTGGLSSFAGFSYTKNHYTRIDTKTLNVSMSERTTVRRQIFPQAHLSGFFSLLTEGGVSMDRFVHDVDLDADPFFQRRRLQVVPRVDFAREAVTSVRVDLRYADEAPRTLVFDAGDEPQDVDWPYALDGGRRVEDVALEYTVNLAAVPGFDRPVALTAPVQQVSEDVVEVITRELYEIVPVTITALDVPWDRFPQVQVDLSYKDPAHLDPGRQVAAEDTVLLDRDTPEVVWNLFVARGGPRDFTATITYRAADFRDVTLAPVTGDDTTLTIRTPYPQSRRRVLEVVPVADWTRTGTIFVDLLYVDEPNDVREEASLRFSQDDAQPTTFGVDLADPQRRLVEYQVTVIGVDGRVERSPSSQTLDRRLLVRPGMLGHRIIGIVPAEADFAARQVSSVAVEVVYEDPDNGVRFADTVTLTGGQDRGVFEFDYVNEAVTTFSYSVATTWTNGLTSRTPSTSADVRRDLVVPIGD